jgi:hypothetical protein
MYLSEAACVAIDKCRTPLCPKRHVPPFYFGAMVADAAKQDQLFYVIAMGAIPGVTLWDFLRSAQGKEGRRQRVGADMYVELERAVASMWAKGVSHSDLHTENVMYDAAANRVYIIDFGFALYMGDEAVKKLRKMIAKAIEINVPIVALTQADVRNSAKSVYVKDLLQQPNAKIRRMGYAYYNPDYRVLIDLYSSRRPAFYETRQRVWGYTPTAAVDNNNRATTSRQQRPVATTAIIPKKTAARNNNKGKAPMYTGNGAPSSSRRQTRRTAAAAARNNNVAGGSGGAGGGNNNNNNNYDNQGDLDALREYLATRDAGNFAAPGNAAPAADKLVVARLGHMAKLNLHGFGLVVREIPNAVAKVLELGWTLTNEEWRKLMHVIHRVASGAEAMPAAVRAELSDYRIRGTPATIVKRFYFANMVRQDLREAIHDRQVCRQPIGRRFVRFHAVGGGHKDDNVTFLAYKLKRADAGLRFQAVALGSYSTAEPTVDLNANNTTNGANGQFTMTFADQQHNQWLQAKRIAELDVMCSSDPGAGPALLSHILARIALRKKAGSRRYKGVVMYFAESRDGRMPMQKSATSFGFTPMESIRMQRGTVRTGRRVPYYASFDTGNETWVQRTVDRLQAMVFSGRGVPACPTVPRSGRTYCV